MLLSQLETSNVRLFSYDRPSDLALVKLTRDCEQGQAYDHGTRIFLGYFLSCHATVHRRVYAINSACRRLLFDGNIRCCGRFADKTKGNSNWSIRSEGSHRGQMQVLQHVES